MIVTCPICKINQLELCNKKFTGSKTASLNGKLIGLYHIGGASEGYMYTAICKCGFVGAVWERTEIYILAEEPLKA